MPREGYKSPGEWAAGGDPYDCTTEICQLGATSAQRARQHTWPMYSYERPAYMFWNAIAAGLHKRGWSDEQIKAWLQSKNPRWALDGKLGEDLEELGAKYAETITKAAIGLPTKDTK